MKKVGCSEFRKHMAGYLAAARKGQSVLIRERGRPVAKLCPSDSPETPKNHWATRLRNLEARGLLHLAKHRLKKIRLVPCRGKSAAKTIIEGRR